MAIKIKSHKLKGVVDIPPSKSLAHRAIICASLARGKSIIRNVEYSDDIEATIQAMKTLGTMIFKHDNYLEIDGTTTFMMNNCDIDCQKSGSTLRFLVPVSLVYPANVHFVGHNQLGKRPLDVYYRIFDEQNIGYLYREDALDLYVRGQLHASEFFVPGDVSSQFISGLLFALPLMQGDSRIVLTSCLESKSYVDLTISMLNKFGIRIINHNYEEFIIPGMQRYQASEYEVEGDFSQAAFYFAGSALGNEIKVKGLNNQSLQGDRVIIDVLEQMGCQCQQTDEGWSMKPIDLHGITLNGSQCPDIIPAIALVASLSCGQTTITQLKRLKFKESNRLEAIVDIIQSLGGNIKLQEDTLIIEGVEQLQGAFVSSYDDHRLAMIEAIASSRTKGDICIDHHTCVSKSYPHFWKHFCALGGEYDEYDMGK